MKDLTVITELTLSDGSKVFDVKMGNVVFACTDRKAAISVALSLENIANDVSRVVGLSIID